MDIIRKEIENEKKTNVSIALLKYKMNFHPSYDAQHLILIHGSGVISSKKFVVYEYS